MCNTSGLWKTTASQWYDRQLLESNSDKLFSNFKYLSRFSCHYSHIRIWFIGSNRDVNVFWSQLMCCTVSDTKLFGCTHLYVAQSLKSRCQKLVMCRYWKGTLAWNHLYFVHHLQSTACGVLFLQERLVAPTCTLYSASFFSKERPIIPTYTSYNASSLHACNLWFIFPDVWLYPPIFFTASPVEMSTARGVPFLTKERLVVPISTLCIASSLDARNLWGIAPDKRTLGCNSTGNSQPILGKETLDCPNLYFVQRL